MRRATQNFSILIIVVISVTAGASAQQQFIGNLRPKLVPSEARSVWQWNLATAKDLSEFTRRPPSSATVQVGTLIYGAKSNFKFLAALVMQPGQRPCLYIDRNHKGRFSTNSRVCFHASPAGSFYAYEAEVNPPLS